MQTHLKKSFAPIMAGIGIFALCLFSQIPAVGQAGMGYIQHNLVSNQPNTAITTDPNLKNAWGIAFSPTGPFWISDNGAGVSTVYNGSAAKLPLTVTIPPPEGSTDTATPTGIAFNGSSGFVVSEGGKSGPAVFIFATEDGTISGWNPNVNGAAAILAVDDSDSDVVYKGLAIFTGQSGSSLFATDFHNNA